MLNYRSLNIVTLVGRLGRDAELKTSKNGRTFITFSVATETSMKSVDGTWSHPTTWTACKVFGSCATAKMAAALTKGTVVTVVGHLANFESSDGEGKKRAFTYVSVDDLQLLPPGSGGSRAESGASSSPATQPKSEPSDDSGDIMDYDF